MFWYWITAIVIVITILLGVKNVRKHTFSTIILVTVRKLNIFPKISATEMTAIEAGNIGVESLFFKPKLTIDTLQNYQEPQLSAQEQAFLAGPVEQLCKLISDWDIWTKRDVPKSVWTFLREKQFFGIIIPEQYGGLGFSRLAHSAIVLKLSSHSIPVAITAMVPNSLGPAELLLKYGTKDQKNRYLPKLAKGEEIPCFALTELEAGSDASSLTAKGIVIKKNNEIMIQLNWEKRWITLGSAATLIGVAFRLQDPDNLLSKNQADLGITCALVPSSCEGISNEYRHDPLGVPFINSRIAGKNVEVPLNAIIGEKQGIGQGWLMLTRCLAAGRGLSLPAFATGCTKLALAVTTAHASIRYQFGIPLANFEGVREPLSRIAGLAFIMDASRKMCTSAMDKSGTLSVISSILKYHFTELNRIAINDAMDILGGTGISRGPHNPMAHAYIATPIGITVEGSNIITRTLMIFGQGAMRSHPFAFNLMQAVNNNDLNTFDKNLTGWIRHTATSAFYSVLCYLTRGRILYLTKMKPCCSLIKKNYWRLGWASACFNCLTNIAMLTLGGKLKKKEHISGRFADGLSWLIINWAVLQYVEQHDKQDAISAVAKWSLEYGFRRIQTAIEHIVSELGGKYTNVFWRYVALPIVRLNPLSLGPKDNDIKNLCESLNDKKCRTFLLQGIFQPTSPEPLARLEAAYQVVRDAQPIYQKINIAIKQHVLSKSNDFFKTIALAKTKSIINASEYQKICATEQQRREALMVDVFSELHSSPDGN